MQIRMNNGWKNRIHQNIAKLMYFHCSPLFASQSSSVEKVNPVMNYYNILL